MTLLPSPRALLPLALSCMALACSNDSSGDPNSPSSSSCAPTDADCEAGPGGNAPGDTTGNTDGNNSPGGGGNGSLTLPKHVLVGYWHNFSNPSGPAFPLSEVSDDWDVIDIAFASNSTPSGSVAFELDPSLNVEQFKADVAAKRAKGKKVVLSLGGQEGTVSLANASDTDNFVSSLVDIIKTYGFDGLDIDLESGAGVMHGAPVQTNLVDAVKRIKAQTLGGDFFLSMAPEHPYVQGGYTAYAGIWGAYLPLIEGLRDDLTILHVQLYNNGGLNTPWGPFDATTVDMLVSSVDMLLSGFQPSGGPAFKGLRADQVAFGVPSGNQAANAGNFVSVDTIKAAFTCVTEGTSCGTHKPSATYPNFRGVMTWSINWDRFDGPELFSKPVAQFLHGKP